jgi:hypothetical protein
MVSNSSIGATAPLIWKCAGVYLTNYTCGLWKRGKTMKNGGSFGDPVLKCFNKLGLGVCLFEHVLKPSLPMCRLTYDKLQK